MAKRGFSSQDDDFNGLVVHTSTVIEIVRNHSEETVKIEDEHETFNGDLFLFFDYVPHSFNKRQRRLAKKP